MLISPMMLSLIALFLGASFGSFVTAVSYRLPRGEDIVVKPSRCPKCNTTLRVLDLFPIFSWLFNRGKCRHCKAPVSIRYPLTEFLLALVFLVIAQRYGASWLSLLLGLLAIELAIMIVTDFEFMIIPDSIQVAVSITGIFYAVLVGRDWSDVLLTVAVMGGLGLALHYGYPYFRKKDGLGFGDVKFLAAAGFWLPLIAFPWFLFLAGLTGIVTWAVWRMCGGGEQFPFGPALALALFINVLMPELLAAFIGNWHTFPA